LGLKLNGFFILLTHCIYLFHVTLKTNDFSRCNINKLVFLTEANSVSCEVRILSLYKMRIDFSLQWICRYAYFGDFEFQ